MLKRRTEIRLAALIVMAVGLLLSAVVGLFVYVSVTTTPIHPNPHDVASAPQSTPSPQWADAVDRARQTIRAGIVEQNLPGVSVAVGVGGDIVWAEGFGWADLDTRVAVTPKTRFRVGTASKALTSAAVGLLLEQGRLTLDEEIQVHVPAYPTKSWPVTLRHLMGHTAGLRADAGDEEPIHVHCDQPGDALPRFADAPLLFAPGTRYHYSSYGWILVSAAVEGASGTPFDTYMRKQVFEPLGLHDTRPDAVTGTSPSQATYYFPRFAADPRHGPQEPDEEDFSCFAGASAFVSTPSDLVRFGIAITRGALLKPSTVQTLQALQRLASGEETGYGLGWDLEAVTLAGEQTHTVGYDGELRGGRVISFLIVASHDVVVAVTSNTSHADTSSLAVRLAEAFIQGPRASTGMSTPHHARR